MEQSFAKGLAWTSGVKWGAQLVTWVTTVIVARILTPADYGLVAMATSAGALVAMLSEFGIGTAVVTLRTLSERQIEQLAGLALVLGIAGFGVSVAVAAPLGQFFASPRLPPIVVVVGATFIASAFGVVPGAILRKELQFRTVALVEGAQQLLAAGTTVGLAVAGASYWALVFGRVVELVFASIVLLALRTVRMRIPRVGDIREALRFSSHIIGSRVTWWVYSEADYVIAGRILGQSTLGLYRMAFSFSRMPAEKIAGMITRVAPATFSALQDDIPELRRFFTRIMEGLAVATFPALIGLAMVAPHFVPVVLGEQWVGMVTPLQVLCIASLSTTTEGVFPHLLNVIGETRHVMNVSIAAAILLPLTFVGASAFWGLNGLAVSWLVLHPVTVAAPQFLRIRKRTGMHAVEFWKTLQPALVSSALMVTGIVALQAFWKGSPLELLVVEIVVGASIYSVALWQLFPSTFRRLLRFVRLVARR